MLKNLKSWLFYAFFHEKHKLSRKNFANNFSYDIFQLGESNNYYRQLESAG